MYNGIGIQSTRGTGTSGHVQRNVAALHRVHRRRTTTANPNQRLRSALLKRSGDAQRAHEARRRVEVAVAELEEELGARGYDDDTIATMAQRLREDLLSRGEDEGKWERERELEKRRGGSELVEHRNEKLRGLLGVQEDYVEGTGFRNMRSTEERVHANGAAPEAASTPQAVPPTGTAVKDGTRNGAAPNGIALNDIAPQDAASKDTVQKDAVPNNVSKEKERVNIPPSDTESSSLSESSGESDPDDVPEVTKRHAEVDAARGTPTAKKLPSPENVTVLGNAGDAEKKRERASEPETRELREPENGEAAKPPERSLVRSSPHRGREYTRRGRSRSPPSLSEEPRRESPYRRQPVPRHRDPSPYSWDASPHSRDPSLYDRSRTPPNRNRGWSPYDHNRTPRNYYEHDSSPDDYRRSRYHRSSRRRSRSYSRLHMRRRRRRYRSESPVSLSTSTRSASPYRRRASSPYRRSPSPRRRSSPYDRRSSHRRPWSPYPRKRSYSGYSPSRRVRHRRRSPYGYRYPRGSERRERDHEYSSSESDSSGSWRRYRTPPRRSRFSDYPYSPSSTLSPRRPRRYSASPAD